MQPGCKSSFTVSVKKSNKQRQLRTSLSIHSNNISESPMKLINARSKVRTSKGLEPDTYFFFI